MSTQPVPSMRGLVSLDGNTNIISTQLRLLPPSPKVLILPPLSTAIRQREGDVPFDARAFIRHVHEVLSARLELARTFLQSSSGTQPRLVFMNGGCASALTACLAAISEKVTNGNIQEAEELFNAIAKGGVAGLLREGETVDRHKGNNVLISQTVNGVIFSKTQETRSPSTTSYIAPSVTEAAEFIDLLIDSLQKPLPSLPVDGGNVDMTNSSEHTRTTTTPAPPDVLRLKSKFWTDQQVIPQIERVVKEASRSRKLGNEDKGGNHACMPHLRSTSTESSTYTDAVMFQTRTDFDGDSLATQPERPASAPSTHTAAKQNEYSYLYVEGKLSRSMVKKAKSVDCLRTKDGYATSLDIGPRKLKLGTFSPFTFSPLLRSEASSISDSDISDVSETSGIIGSLPGTTYTRELETESSSPLKTVSSDAPRVFVNRDTYTRNPNSLEKMCPERPDAASVEEPAPFVPVFAMVEDLVIHFKDGSGNEVLDSVVQSYKSGSYPIVEHNIPQIPMIPNSPASLFSSTSTSLSGASHPSADTDDDWLYGASERDSQKPNARPLESSSDVTSDSSSDISVDSPPYSPSVYPSDEGSIAPSDGPSNMKQLKPRRDHPGNTVHGILKPRLQIPVTNPSAPPPPELSTDALQKIYELSDISTTNAVTLQDSLRGVLKSRYPSETTHYKQHIFALENDRFWKPVFRMDARQGGEKRTVDQIIALGYEDGVEKALYKELVEQFDKLGTSTTGIRASKLDIRFLVIYAMQTFTSQPLSLQAGDNPFSQRSLLATLLIPHLETFLSSSGPNRLLILHYPVSHLSTVLALRDLLGPELLKVAGIIDSTAISPLKPSKERPNPIASIDEWVSTTTSKFPSPTQKSCVIGTPQITQRSIMSQPSFSKADFLLLSPASEDEISTFLTSVWESLTFPSSSFYFPDEVLSPSSTLHPIISPSTASSHNAPPTPPPDRQILATRSQKRLSPTRAPKRVSFADSSTSTEISNENARRRERQSEKDWEKLESERRERLSEKAWESFIMGNDSDESLLELERIFMPHLHFMPRAARRIGDSRKALKWLGLD